MIKTVFCGSMKLYSEMENFATELAIKHLVHVGLPTPYGEESKTCPLKETDKDACIKCLRRHEEKAIHLERVKEADFVVAFNKGGHVGNDSFGELCVANYLGVDIFYLDEPTEFEDVDKLAYVEARPLSECEHLGGGK